MNNKTLLFFWVYKKLVAFEYVIVDLYKQHMIYDVINVYSRFKHKFHGNWLIIENLDFRNLHASCVYRDAFGEDDQTKEFFFFF